MRTTIELPDELMTRAKIQAAVEGTSLKNFFVSAVERRLAEKKKPRLPPPVILTGPTRDATPEEIAEAMSPIQHILDEIERNRR